ncbi:MAG: hypothetical protein PQ975_00925 [Methanobacterium sp.]|jgi:hypothetical protein
MESEYYWDDDKELNRRLFSFNNLDDLERIKINGINARKLLDKQKLSLGIWDNSKTIFIPVYDKFGDLIVEYNNNVIRRMKIVPWKLSKHQKTPEEVYNYITNDIFEDISYFLSYVIKNMKKDIKSIDSFSYQLLNDFPKSTDFLVYLLEYNCNLLEKSLFNIYNSGPLHKEIEINTDYSGSQLVLTSLINPSPYKLYNKKRHTHETTLNQMMFQSAYFMMQASKMVEERLDPKNELLKKRTNKIFQKSNSLLNKYDLWSFFSTETLVDGEIRSRLISQNNPFYKDAYKIFKIVRDIIVYIALIAALRIEKGVEMPLTEFYTIYEIWTIAKIWGIFQNKGFMLKNVEIGSFNLISAKMTLNLVKGESKAKVIWEMHLDPADHSTYYGGLIRELNLSDKDTKIKPDVTVIFECKDLKKTLIGDVKFTMKKGKSALPKLESLYKVLSYVEDLKRSPIFEGFGVEGLLIYPGNMDSAKTPYTENDNCINITSLNMFNQNFEKIFEVKE